MFYFLMVAIRPYLIVKNELHRNVEPDYFIDQHYSFYIQLDLQETVYCPVWIKHIQDVKIKSLQLSFTSQYIFCFPSVLAASFPLTLH